MENCVFCKIISGQIPSYEVFSNDKVFCFLDINPINPGHLLMVPKTHVDKMYDLDSQDFREVFVLAKIIAKTLEEKFEALRTGMMVEGFGVAHAHLHLIPIFGPGEISFERAKSASEKDLKKNQELISSAIQELVKARILRV